MNAQSLEPWRRTWRSMRAFDPAQLWWRAVFTAERAAAPLVAPILSRRIARATHDDAPVLVDVGRAMAWRRRHESLDDAWVEAALNGWLVVLDTPLQLPSATHAPAFWLQPVDGHPDAHHLCFELWSHGFAPMLAHTVRVAPEPLADAALDLLQWLWTSWSESVTLDASSLGGAWHPWVVARRALHWLEAIEWLQGRRLPTAIDDQPARQGITAEKVLPGIWRTLARHGAWLELHLERDVRGNHLLTDGLALMALGLAFARRDWFDRGARVWSRDLPAQILSDGTHYERSPMYHAEVLAMTLDAMGLVERSHRVWGSARRLHKRLAARLGPMTQALERLLHGDDQIALIGDSAHGIAPSVSALRERAREILEKLPAPPRKLIPRRRSDSGLVRLEDGARVAIVDAAPFGPRTLPAHGHCDAGSFELGSGTRRLVVDGGTATYDAGPLRDYFRGSRAHNTLVVPGRDQSEVWGAFRVGRRATVRCTHRDARRVELTVRGWFDARGSALTWHRAIALVDDGLEIIDRLDDEPPPGTRLQLRLSPETRVLDRGTDRLTLETDGLRWQLVGDVEAVRTAWYAPRFGTLQHVPLVELTAPAPGAPRTTRLILSSDAQA